MRANLAVLTSAVRDATNGAPSPHAFAHEFALDARVLSRRGRGSADVPRRDVRPPRARGADRRDRHRRRLHRVRIGLGTEIAFHTSRMPGVVRMSERHIHPTRPRPRSCRNSRSTPATYPRGASPRRPRPVRRGIAVAGTATSAASIDQELEPYDPAMSTATRSCWQPSKCSSPASPTWMKSDAARSPALTQPRPTIVAGMILLEEAIKAFDLDKVEVSEHDILYGGALPADPPPPPPRIR